jgi:hypothetical protein
MPIDPESEFEGSNQIDGKSDGKKCGVGGQYFVNQQLRRLVDDRAGVRGEKAHRGWLQPRDVWRRVGLEMGKGLRASAAPHEVFGGGFIMYSSLGWQ